MEAEGGALQWSREHNSEFSFEKLGLLNCSRSQPDLGPPLKLQQSTVSPTEAHKFLGILVDRALRFREHVAYSLAKGTKWVAQFKRVMRPCFGLSYRLSKRLYFSIAVPSFLYAVDVFITPVQALEGRKRLYGSVGAVNKLARVHRQALLMMTGALRTTATDVLEAHTDILPFRLLVDKLCQRATVRMCTLPPRHPLARHIASASKRY
ncbi:hypothetical protein OBBRIDRAFT_741574, partial [Obba rivulosa]